MLQERDPAQRQKDLDAVKALTDNPETNAMLMLFAYKGDRRLNAAELGTLEGRRSHSEREARYRQPEAPDSLTLVPAKAGTSGNVKAALASAETPAFARIQLPQ